MQKVLRGEGSLEKLDKALSRITGVGGRILLVTYGQALANPRIQRVVTRLKARYRVAHYPFSTPLMTIENLEEQCGKMRAEYRGVGPEVIVSIGGGSVLDLAKCLRVLAGSYGTTPRGLLYAKTMETLPRDAGLYPLHIAVPTTAGTGSEATPFSTVYVDGVKQSVDDPLLLPDRVILDPALLWTLKQSTAVHCAFDALAQSVESMWSIRSNDQSVDLSLQAIANLLRGLKGEKFTYAALQEGAFQSGHAIRITRTTLPHALSYPMTSTYRVPHGLAVFLTLPAVARFNGDLGEGDCAEPRGVAHVKRQLGLVCGAFGVTDAAGLSGALTGLMERFGVSPRLADYGIKSRAEVDTLIQSAVGSPRAGNNPRLATAENLKPYFAEIMDGIADG